MLTIICRPGVLGLMGVLVASLVPALASNDALKFEDRVRAETALARVRHAQRVWPRDNALPKPSFEHAVPAEQIAARVQDVLDKSAALEAIWQRPITPAMLQAEIDRMVRGSRDRRTLEALFAALGHDPLLIAEALARPVLADRLIHNWYAFDERFHGDARRQARALLERSATDDWSRLGGAHERIDYVPADGALESTGEQAVTDQELEELRERYPQPGAPAVLDEDGERVFLARTLRSSSRRLEVEVLSIAKTSFDDWWQQVRQTVQAWPVIERGGDGYHVDAIAGGPACDAWTHPSGFGDDTGEGRQAFTAIWTGTEMIVWGGLGGVALNSGGRYDPATDTWLPVSKTNAPSPRFWHAAVWTGTEMIVWGGGETAGGYPQVGGRYNPATDTWTPTSTGPGVPIGRWHQTAVWTGTEMIVWGGHQNGFPVVNTGGRYDPLTDSWAPTSTGAGVPAARTYHTSVWTGTRMMIWGGGGTAGFLATGALYDPTTDSWSPHATAGQPAGRNFFSTVWTGTEMIVWGGGASTGLVNSGGRYNATTDSWSATSTASGVPTARESPAAVWTGSEMIVWSGRINPSAVVNTGGRYNPATNTWTATSTVNAPLARTNARTVWTGSEMIGWGGINMGVGSDLLKVGGRYDPVSNTWLPTSPGTSLPSGRTGTPTIWTGNELIVWGGNQGWTGNGARYEPAIDAWSPISQGANVPHGRWKHSGVWTGTHMVVWGGQTTVALATGGRYNPATDSWLATSTAGAAPSARFDHTAVWTGTRMIVWGGGSDTGARYDPAADTWSATSLVNQPAVRSGNTAVWTGTEMIVWGGGAGPSFFNTGGRYNPTTNVWTATSIGANVPSGRWFHTAVWTGNRMIVWGGTAGAIYHATGGIYDPMSNTWTATPAGPSARAAHSAVWSDTEMFVWGGFASPNSLDNGSRYNPTAGTWNPIGTIGGPPARRFGHLAAWTGSSMIVWGGSASGSPGGGSQPLGSGGIYDFALPGSPGDTLRVSKTATTVDLVWGTIANADFYTVRRCGEPVGCVPTTAVATPTDASYSEPMESASHFYLIETSNPCGSTP